MWRVEQEVDDAIDRLLSVEGFYCKKCSAEKAKQIITAAKNYYVVGEPRVWWLNLNRDNATYKSFLESEDYGDFGLEMLSKYGVVNSETVWFAPETDESEFPDLPVYETTLNNIEKVLRECFFFESYILAKNFSWICIENDHNETIIGQLNQV